ncbi:MAG: hypothetical protein PHD53_00155 [Methylococcales bacterium]|nr:hypothetical protein [Methylococcales bacterium]
MESIRQIQGDWIATISALDASNNPVTLYFSDKGYRDDSGRYFESRMKQPAVINISGNDGGLLKVMGSSSTGEIILNNIDGRFNYLADYALDGRDCILQLISPQGVVTTWFRGMVTRNYERGNEVSLTLKSLSESLDTPLALSRYLGTGGVEGTASIAGNVKPRVYGSPLNCTPILCLDTSLVYQVSDSATTTITGVFDKGSALTLGVVRASLALLLSTTPAAGTFDTYQGYFRLGSVGAQQITCDATDTLILAGDVFNQICTTIQFSSGQRIIGEQPVIVNSVTHEYQISVRAGCVIDDVFNNGTRFTWDGVSYGTITDLRNATITAGFYGKFQGSFIVKPLIDSQYPFGEIALGTITCNATDTTITYADTKTITVNPTAITILNSVGQIGLFISSDTTVRDVLDKIVKSCGGYYWLGDRADVSTSYNTNLVNAALYQEPSATADLTLYAYRIEGSTITRTATGAGENGLPLYSIVANYGKNETVQTDVLGTTTAARKSLVAVASKIQESADLAVKNIHPQALRLSFESLLVSQVNTQTVTDRLLTLFKKRFDVVTLTYFFDELPRLTIGMTVKLLYPRLGYAAGVNMVVAGYKVNVQLKSVEFNLIGHKL